MLNKVQETQNKEQETLLKNPPRLAVIESQKIGNRPFGKRSRVDCEQTESYASGLERYQLDAALPEVQKVPALFGQAMTKTQLLGCGTYRMTKF